MKRNLLWWSRATRLYDACPFSSHVQSHSPVGKCSWCYQIIIHAPRTHEYIYLLFCIYGSNALLWFKCRSV